MKHVYAIIAKFVIIAIILEITLGLMTDLNFSEILMISLSVTILAYLIGDLFILSISNNTIATIADIVLTFLTILAFNYVYGYGRISYWDSIVSAVVVGIGEWFFHKYVAHHVFPNREEIH